MAQETAYRRAGCGNDGTNLDRSVLSPYTSRLIETAAGAILRKPIHVEGDPYPLPRGIELSAYRIVQEGLTNALKHAGASRVEVTVYYGKADLRITVVDDGRGFDEGSLHARPGAHFGLRGMRERAARAGAKLSVFSREQGGTEVELRVARNAFAQPSD